jgi:hypothetical protein
MMLLYAVRLAAAGRAPASRLNSAADLKGMKWRAYSPATARIAELVGAQPVTVQAAEFAPGLCHRRRRKHDDLRAPPASTPSCYEHVKYCVRHAGLAAEERRDREPVPPSTPLDTRHPGRHA